MVRIVRVAPADNLAVENIRLKELALVTAKNRPVFDDMVGYFVSVGYQSLHDFVCDRNEAKGYQAIEGYLQRNLPAGISMFDGVARPYPQADAKWKLLGWVFRDAPSQRLAPMVSSMGAVGTIAKRATILNRVRIYVALIFPEAEKWTWEVISEVVIDRLEGSRRAIKGTLFEAIVRRHLIAIFAEAGLPLTVSEVEITLEGETFDVIVHGSKGKILIPVKTRETMGGGHAILFTRDIHKAIAAAHNAELECLPVIIAESWGGNLGSLKCKHQIYINKNPNQIDEVEPLLAAAFKQHLDAFRLLT